VRPTACAHAGQIANLGVFIIHAVTRTRIVGL
jgi:hypothetical protein